MAIERDFSRVKLLLAELVETVRETFSEGERNEVREFVDVGEYGLALETFVDIVEGEGRRVDARAVVIAEQLAVRMEMDEKEIVDRLTAHLE